MSEEIRLQDLPQDRRVRELITEAVHAAPGKTSARAAQVIADGVLDRLAELGAARHREVVSDEQHWHEFHSRRRREQEAKLRPAFERLLPRLGGFADGGHTVPLVRAVRNAVETVREYRLAKNDNRPGEDTDLAIRVTCDTLASEIASASGGEQDPATVAWVVAGLRCRARPFCVGCRSCQTVTAPTRPMVERAPLWR